MHSVESHRAAPDVGISRDRPLVSVVVPAYNEAEILPTNLTVLCDYLARLEEMYRWEVIIVNDGSTDDTGRWPRRSRSTGQTFACFITGQISDWVRRYAMRSTTAAASTSLRSTAI